MKSKVHLFYNFLKSVGVHDQNATVRILFLMALETDK